MKTLPATVAFHKRTPDFNQDTVPAGLTGQHMTARGVWGKITVTEGSLLFRLLEPGVEEYVLDSSSEGIVPPQVAHQVEIIEPVKFHVAFYRAA